MSNSNQIRFFFEEIASPSDMKGMLAEVFNSVSNNASEDAVANLGRLWVIRDFLDLFTDSQAT